jgi:nitronate monooxygenase
MINLKKQAALKLYLAYDAIKGAPNLPTSHKIKKMWSKNPIVKRCHIRFPLIQAPMAGIATPRLVAAVSNAGGLGSLGAANMPPEEIKNAIQEIRDFTEMPFAVNLFCFPPPTYNQATIDAAQKFLKSFRKELDIPEAPPDLTFPDFAAQIEAILEARPPVFSFTMGIPPLPILERLKKENIAIMGTATTLDEALLLEKCGVDAVIAQGAEAGGHRGTFLQQDPMLGTTALLSTLSPALKIPIIAAGGIMNGDAIAAALALGAAAVQLGTAFLACPESGAPLSYKQTLLHSQTPTTITHAFTGKPARMLQNKFIHAVERENAPIAPYPYQNLLTRDIRTAAAKLNRTDLMSIYAGQNYPLITNLPASEIVPLLTEQTIRAVQKLNIDLLEKTS